MPNHRPSSNLLLPIYSIAILLLVKATFTSAFVSPSAHLTNSIYSPNEDTFSTESQNEIETDTEDVDDAPSSYRNKLTFRRRNINSNIYGGGGNSIPFSRYAYKSGYGSNRRGNGMMGRPRKNNYPMQGQSSLISNPFSLYNTFSGDPSSFYQSRSGSSFGSGLLGQKPMSIYGSSVSTRGKYGNGKMSGRTPFDHYGSSDIYSSYAHSYFPSYNRMSRFNNYGPYDNPLFYNRLGSSSSSNDMDPYAQIATNQWQISRPNSIVAAKDSGIDVDSYNDGFKEKTSKT